MRIYLAGPYTLGDVAVNVKTAMDAADTLIARGHAVFCPHLSHFLHLNHSRPYQFWTKHDLAWLPVCDVLVRIPGMSHGADAEEVEARRLGIPVVTLEEALYGPPLIHRTEEAPCTPPCSRLAP